MDMSEHVARTWDMIGDCRTLASVHDPGQNMPLHLALCVKFYMYGL